MVYKGIYINIYIINDIFLCICKWGIWTRISSSHFNFSTCNCNRIFFDIVGVAVTVANEHEFHAKATKKVKGSKDSIKLIRNAPKVANFVLM